MPDFDDEVEDREHPYRLSARFHRQRVGDRARRSSEERRHADLRRVRRVAADRQARPGAGNVSFPVRLHRQGGRHGKGVTEPQATFSTCSARRSCRCHPTVYGELLRELIARHHVDCWLVNTGWTGGKFGAGRRMPIRVTAVWSRPRSTVRSARGFPHRSVFRPRRACASARRRAAHSRTDQDLAQQG